MKTFEVLGTGCPKCRATVQVIEETAKARGAEVTVRKIEALDEIIARGVMSTPAVLAGGKVLLVGRVPTRRDVEGWLAS